MQPNMFAAIRENKHQHLTGILLICICIPGFLGVRLQRHATPMVDDREPCENVSLQLTSSQDRLDKGFFDFANDNETVEIYIKDEGTKSWNIGHAISLPSVYIDGVVVTCVSKGMCKEITTSAIHHWRFEAKKLRGDEPFATSLAFAADPPIAGCICYMEAMMLGHTRNRLFVQTKPIRFKVHPGYDVQGSDILWQEDGDARKKLEGRSLTIVEAVEACEKYISGCKSFSISIDESHLRDPEAKFAVGEYHFKNSVKLTVQFLDTVTSVRLGEGEDAPYELVYEPRQGRHWHRDWCKQQFGKKVSWPPFHPLRSRLQGKTWLFL
jgi:hypothetical protein